MYSLQGIKASFFALLTEKKNVDVLAVLKSCDTANYMSTDGQYFKQTKFAKHGHKNQVSLYSSFYWLGVASWWSSSPKLGPRRTVQDCTRVEWMATCDILTDLEFESTLRCPKASTSITRPSGWLKMDRI